MRSFLTRIMPLLILSLSLLNPLGALADCSDTEMTAVMILDQVYPGFAQALETVSVYPVSEYTYPSEAELYAAVTGVVECPVYLMFGSQSQYRHYFCQPPDYGSSVILDLRTSQMPFLGTVAWSGQGEVLIPDESTHGWSVVEGDPASAPASIEVFDSDLFGIMDQSAFIDQVLAELRQTDVLHSFAACGEYTVVVYPYTPTVNPLDPMAVKAVVMVNGTCGTPWNGAPVPADRAAWGSVKSLFR